MNKRGEIFRPFFIFIRMKYIIPENKLEKLIFKYLDAMYGDLEKFKPKHYEGVILKKPNNDSEYGIIGWRKHGEYSRDSVIYVDDDFTDNIHTFFNLEFPDNIDIITKWIYLRYNLESEHINWTFGSVRNLLKIDTN